MESIRKVFLVAVAFLILASAREIHFFLPRFSDDLDIDSLILAVRRNLSTWTASLQRQFFTTGHTILPSCKCVRAKKLS